jgi:hypothetical protein
MAARRAAPTSGAKALVLNGQGQPHDYDSAIPDECSAVACARGL